MQKETIKGFRLSPQQKHLWLLQQKEAEFNSPYRVQCAIQIDGNLDGELLEKALKELVNRYEILRTSFHCLPGMDLALQVICDRVKLPLVKFDWADLTPEEQTAEFESLWNTVKQQPFNFQKDSLFQVHLIHLADQKHKLLISLPAVYGDTITLRNLVSEIGNTYSGICQNQPLADVSMQYADLAAVLNELVESEETLSGREYWQKQKIFGSFEDKFPGEKETNSTVFNPKLYEGVIQSKFFVKLDAIAQKFNTSHFALLLTSWQILLRKLIGQSEGTIGIACDGRTYEELASTLGLLAKVIPFNYQIEESDKFSDILQQVDAAIAQHLEFQEYFSWEAIGKQTDYFPFCFELETLPAACQAGDMLFTLDRQYACIDRCKIKLACLVQEDSLITTLHYNANLFEAEDIEQLAARYQALLASVANHPEALISELEILSDRDRQKILVEFNQTKTSYPQDKCIHQLFEAQVARTPNNIAVVFNQQKLTYEELNARANQLAHYLQKLGVQPEKLVGVCVERSLEMAIAVLGILKAGGAYVPIDPAYPMERKTFILEDTQMPILLTQQSLIKEDRYKAKIIFLDTDWEIIDRESTENPTSKTVPENLAYAIYTSGSTGKPKGTLIPHQGLVNYLSWCTQAYSVEQGKGTLVHSPLGFDLTITSLFSPLLVGCPVELLPESQSIENLSNALREKDDLSLVKITPAHLELLGQQLSTEKAAERTKAFIIGGENLLVQHIDFWQKNAPNTMLVNEYGPTETVVGCCVYKVPIGEHDSGSIPIGKPIANTQLYVLNQHLQPVPIGAVGELHIGGVGVSRGYLNRPDLTAEKFIPNPFSDEPGTRLYKTGDLARYQPDGTLECLGRIDNQVKIRGFRIELGEVEAVLSEHPEVQEAVVLAQEDVSGGRLVAYLVCRENLCVDGGKNSFLNELRCFIKRKLPEYMVPSAFVFLNALPLTINGKIDRKLLPVLAETQPQLESDRILPSTELEQAIASVWQKVLNLEKVGIHDNFFDLGGHSLLVAQVQSKLEELLQRKIPIVQLMEYPSIHSLAKSLSQAPKLEEEVQLVRDRVQKQRDAGERQRQKMKASRSI
ncbi:MAG TPA: amino acid adenylation domain-containing protein [Leptolyngbyaceae cyanobacterium]